MPVHGKVGAPGPNQRSIGPKEGEMRRSIFHLPKNWSGNRDFLTGAAGDNCRRMTAYSGWISGAAKPNARHQHGVTQDRAYDFHFTRPGL
jgi:hypothetical protein